jgi:hypothetical protein
VSLCCGFQGGADFSSVGEEVSAAASPELCCGFQGGVGRAADCWAGTAWAPAVFCFFFGEAFTEEENGAP